MRSGKMRGEIPGSSPFSGSAPTIEFRQRDGRSSYRLACPSFAAQTPHG